MSGRRSSLLMSASTAIAYVQERGAGPEARGDKKECLSSRHGLFALFQCDFSGSAHKSWGLVY